MLCSDPKGFRLPGGQELELLATAGRQLRGSERSSDHYSADELSNPRRVGKSG